MSRVFFKIFLKNFNFFLFNINVFLDIIPKLMYADIEGGTHMMGNAQKIKMALAYKGMSESELAKALGKTPQAFNQRMKTDKFSAEELVQIARVMGASYISEFSFPDGTRI